VDSYTEAVVVVDVVVVGMDVVLLYYFSFSKAHPFCLFYISIYI
jgi:hypothetical protein